MRNVQPLSIYIHIPFCVRKCRYCDFLSSCVATEERERYITDLCEEIREFADSYADRYEVISVFFGGGTPSLLTAEQMTSLMDTVKSSYRLATDCEITMECNPGTTTGERLRSYHQAGINRLSIGLQSTNDDELRELGRIHTYADFLKTYQEALDCGFTNINVDLMSAIPYQTISSYKKTLRNVLLLQPQHISAYSLIIEEGTPLYESYEQGEDIHLACEEDEREMYYETEKLLTKAGYHRYEISNYAKPGYECRHNKVYWERGEYVGFGIGASSLLRLSELPSAQCFRDTRFGNDSSLASYDQKHHRWRKLCETVKEGKNLLQQEEAMQQIGFSQADTLGKRGCMEEFMFLGLRMMRGVSAEAFRLHFGRKLENVYGDVIRKYCASNHLIYEDGILRLTPAGIDVSNVILAEFLLEEQDFDENV